MVFSFCSTAKCVAGLKLAADSYLFTSMLADCPAETGGIIKCNLDLYLIVYPVKKLMSQPLVLFKPAAPEIFIK